jgi:hypothetical protein
VFVFEPCTVQLLLSWRSASSSAPLRSVISPAAGEGLRELAATLGAERAAREVAGLEGDAVARQVVLLEDGRGDDRDVGPGGNDDGPHRRARGPLLGRRQADPGDAPGHRDLVADVARDPVDADQGGRGRPAAGLGAGQLEFDRELRRIGLDLVDVGIHAIGERGQDLLRVRVIARVLGLEVAAEKELAGGGVGSDEARPELLGHLAFAASAPLVELPEPIARGAVALREEQVALVLRVDVGDARRVPDDLDRRGHAGDVDAGAALAIAVVVVIVAAATARRQQEQGGCDAGERSRPVRQLDLLTSSTSRLSCALQVHLDVVGS